MIYPVHMEAESSAFILLSALAYLLTFTCCSESPSKEESVAELIVTEHEIRTDDDEILLHIDDVPRNIPVEKISEFGAAERFTAASKSPVSSWFAITTAGTSHQAGWLFESESANLVPAAFQYGGSVTIGPWSEDARYIAFIEKGPAPIHTLAVVDLKALGTTVEENSVHIHLPEHAEAIPPETEYKPKKWRGSELIFTVDGECYRYDATTRNVTLEQ